MASLAWRSEANRAISQDFSSVVRKRACSGLSVSTRSVTSPIRMVGMPSAIYSHCQPRRPQVPSNPSNAVDTGAPSATATGRPIRKPETMRAWWLCGNQ